VGKRRRLDYRLDDPFAMLMKERTEMQGALAVRDVASWLVWNTFRTLALIDPSFWLRQLHARLFDFDERYRPPETLDVRLWVPVLPPPGHGDRRKITVDVLLESEDTWWGLLTLFEIFTLHSSACGRDCAGPVSTCKSFK
jgi:hypothetical protein